MWVLLILWSNLFLLYFIFCSVFLIVSLFFFFNDICVWESFEAWVESTFLQVGFAFLFVNTWKPPTCDNFIIKMGWKSIRGQACGYEILGSFFPFIQNQNWEKMSSCPVLWGRSFPSFTLLLRYIFPLGSWNETESPVTLLSIKLTTLDQLLLILWFLHPIYLSR